MADDLDIAADGMIYFTDATKRYDIENWGLDLLEGRPNGRLLSFDPKSRKTRTVCDNLIFPNGVCLTHDGQHLLVASTWTCSLLIFDLRNMSDGPAGLRSRAARLSRQRQPGLRRRLLDRACRNAQPGDGRRDAPSRRSRRRMTKRVAADQLAVRQSQYRRRAQDRRRRADLSTRSGISLSGPLYMITSMREHKGALYLGGVTNNKIGRLGWPGPTPRWTGPRSYWEKA